MVKIVTDSTSDIPPEIAQALGITVVPLYVRFGDKAYRDRIDISEDEFYQKLVQSPIHPTTLIPQKEPIITRLSTVIGVHGGPGTLLVALRRGESKEEPEKEKTKKRFSLPRLWTPDRDSPLKVSYRLKIAPQRLSIEPEN